MRVMLFRDAGYGHGDSGPSGLGPVGMDVPDASFVCIGFSGQESQMGALRA